MSSLKNAERDDNNKDWFDEYLRLVSDGVIPRLEDLPRGEVIGYVDVVDIQEDYDSFWAADVKDYKYKYVLRNARRLKEPLKRIRGNVYPLDYDISLEDLLAKPTFHDE